MSRFTTRARTVEMLGRQQVAGIPTAISELFKNAHDAFADAVEVDFFRPERLFILRDNGIGMTMEDFENKWLALGTDSKSENSDELNEIASSLDLKPRIILGEKGIGRLAIATIGPQVLILTRARKKKGVQKLVAAFVNWSMFTLPGLNIEDILIPTRTFSRGKLPNASDVDALVGEARSNLQELKSKIDVDALAKIEIELDSFVVDPTALSRRWKTPTLSGSGYGTHFYIQPVDELLTGAIEAKSSIAPEKANHFTKMLVGFSNTMVPGHEPPVVHTEFRDHINSDSYHSVISETEFFTPEDFKTADHQFRGGFDEFGQFNGTVAVYKGEPQEFSLPWLESRGNQTACGPFKINVAYVQGAQRDSTLSREEFVDITAKLNGIGGIYLYRDGIRILPYGNQDYDFLNIEERRSKSAGYYFFSYRRIFGAIEISKADNPRLIEKAGREGFQENLAYRQFREILENFFIELAANYFRQGGPEALSFTEKRSELSRREIASREREKLVTKERETLEAQLEEFFGAVGLNEPESAVDSLASKLDGSLRSIGGLHDPEIISDRIMKSEDNARKELANIREKYKIVEPKGVGLSRGLQRDLDAYRTEYQRLEQDIFEPASSRNNEVINGYISNLGVQINREERFRRGPKATAELAKSISRRLRRQADVALKKATDDVRRTLKSSMEELDTALDSVINQIDSNEISKMPEVDLMRYSLNLDSQINIIAEQKNGILKGIAQQLESIVVVPHDSGELITRLDMAEVAEGELIALREQADSDFDLVQLGMAVEIIDHEFQSTIRGLRRNLSSLKTWADRYPRIQRIYGDLRRNFSHLDGYLNLFTPLHRRLRRTQTTIIGSDITDFLTELFDERLERHDCQMSATDQFQGHQFVSYRSTFYPVFVNLVDNAIYWLSNQPNRREVKLDVVDGKMIVSNTGPEISVRDREAIFELGFTRKPAGRGLGLYICREVLGRVGYEIALESTDSDSGTSFAIYPTQEAT